MKLYQNYFISKAGMLSAIVACAFLLPTQLHAQQDDLFGTPEPAPSNEVDVQQLLNDAEEAVAEADLGGVPAVEEVDVVVPLPTDEALQAPAEEANNAVDAASKALESLPAPKEEVEEDIFFDAESLVPTGEMGRKSGPTKVNPRLQPGSKLIVVKKNYNSNSKPARLVAAERAMKLGRYDSALEIYDRLYASNKRDPNILMGRAVVLQKLGRDDEAVSAYEQFLDVRPNNVEGQVNMLGLMGQRYPAVALRRLLELSDKYPENVGIMAQIAVVQARLSRVDDAIRYLGMAASMEPQNANHLFNMAVIADRAGSKKDAIKYYEQALEVDTLYGAGKSIPRESVFERLAQLR